MPPSDPAAAAAAAGGSRGSGSGSGTLPPLGAATAATAYTSRPSELAGTLNRSAVVDRSGVAAQRRAARASQEQKHQSAPVAAPQEEYRSLSSGVGLRLPTPLTSRPATSAGTNPFGVSTEGPLSIDLRLASLGSQSARVSPSSDATPYTFSHPHPPSSLAAITQDTNHRVSNFLRHYDGHRRSGSDVMAAPNSPSKIKSHRLLLGHITHLTAAQLEAEQHISRQLSNWHPQRSAKSFAALSSQIRHIISDRLSLFDGGQFTGKTLVEDAGFVSEDIEKKQRQYFRILVPSNVTIVKVDLDVTEGRVDLYVACGEPVNGPPKDRAWSLRGGVGHHSLTLHASDAHFRSGEFFFLTLVAAQTSSVQLKVALGGKNKSLPFDDAPVASGPASSGSRLTARQAAATRHAPSTRNIRKSLEARVRTLMENPKALKEFQRKVAAVRRGQVAGGSSARADERDRSISPDGSPHASEPAATKRAQDSRLPAESGSDRSSSFHRTGVSKPTPPHLLQPQPLTRTTLDHIAHIRSIDGVSAIFYETARELSNPHMLDDHDMILWDDAEATATALRSRAKQANDTDAHSTNPSSPSSSSSATSRQPSQPNSPTSTSRIVVASLQHLIARICARLIIKSRHLDATADLDPWSAEQAHMYRRCATIYEAHLTEIESILRALASPATSTTPLLRALAEPPPPRNFLLANAFDATDNRRFDPAIVDRHRREWLSDHSEKMRQAEERRERILEDRRTQTLAVIDRRERERAEAVASRAAAAARLALQELQRNWLRHLAGTLRHRWLRDARLHLRPMRIESFRKNLAAKRIQTFIRASLALKRKTRANLHFQSFRSLMLLMAANYAAVKRDRAANCIKLFIEQKKGVDSVSRLIKNFRRRVGVCQRAVRRWLTTRHAKLVAWRAQYMHMVGRAHNPLLAEDVVSRERLLQELFTALKEDAMSRYDAYLVDLAAYTERLASEEQKKRILSDHVMDLLDLPVRPRVPVRLDDLTMSRLMEAALAASRDQALRNLQSTTAQDDSHDVSVLLSTSRTGSAKHSGSNSKRAGGSAQRSKRHRAATNDTLEPHAPTDTARSSLHSASRARSRTSSLVGPLTIKV